MTAGTIPILSNIDLGLAQLINALAQVVASDPGTVTPGRIIYNSTTPAFKVGVGGSWVSFLPSTTTLNAIAAAVADVDFNSHKGINVATPTGANDIANKAYVDALAQGISWKQSVKAASTATLTLSGTQTVDGIALSAADRVLVKDQTTGSQNGIYLVQVGAWTRATDADTAAEVQSAAVLVDQGTSNANTAWNQTADGVTLGTTTLTWVQFGSGTSPGAGLGLALNSGNYDVNVDSSSIEINADILRVKAAGIVNAMLASGIDASKLTTGVVALTQGGFGVDLTASAGNRTTARTALVEAGQFLARGKAVDVTGDGSTTSFAATHSLGTKDVTVSVYDVTADQHVIVDVVRTSTSVVTLNFVTAPANLKVYRVVVTALV